MAKSKCEILARLTNEELATVLAALRFWKLTLQNEHSEWPLEVATIYHEIASDSGKIKYPLGPNRIDELCERLNFGG